MEAWNRWFFSLQILHLINPWWPVNYGGSTTRHILTSTLIDGWSRLKITWFQPRVIYKNRTFCNLKKARNLGDFHWTINWKTTQRFSSCNNCVGNLINFFAGCERRRFFMLENFRLPVKASNWKGLNPKLIMCLQFW